MAMSTQLACILLYFNDHAKVTVKNLNNAIMLQQDELERALLTLCYGKFRLLCKTGEKKEIHLEDELCLNENFSSPAIKFKIPLVSTKAIEKKEQVEIKKTVEGDRKIEIEATIVRIMKTKKKVNHMDLLSQSMEQMSKRFKPDPKQIKARIEDLISREYMERDKDQSNIYHYVA